MLVGRLCGLHRARGREQGEGHSICSLYIYVSVSVREKKHVSLSRKGPFEPGCVVAVVVVTTASCQCELYTVLRVRQAPPLSALGLQCRGELIKNAFAQCE